MKLSIGQKSVYSTIFDATMISRAISRNLTDERLREFRSQVFKEIENLLDKMEECKLTENDILDSIDKLYKQYKQFGISFGQAQKPINVLLKYHYYMYEKYLDNRIKIKSVLHCPLDSKNLRELGINRWLTGIDKKEYIEIQNKIHNKMHSLGLHKIDFDEKWDRDYLKRRGLDCVKF